MNKLLAYILMFTMTFSGAIAVAGGMKIGALTTEGVEAELRLVNYLQAQIDILEENKNKKQEMISDVEIEIPNEIMYYFVFSTSAAGLMLAADRLTISSLSQASQALGIVSFIVWAVYTVKLFESAYVLYVSKDSYEEFKYLLQEKKAELELISASHIY